MSEKSATPPAKDDEKKQAQEDEKSAKLSNKELKEMKKQEKAAKRAAKKQESGITIEQQQQLAQAKREKKQQQRERQEQQQKAKTEKKKFVKKGHKSTLFGHLETTEERRVTILAISSAISSPLASKITASGLMLPTVASALSGTSVLANMNSSSSIQAKDAAASGASAAPTGVSSTANAQNDAASNLTHGIAESLAATSLEFDKSSVVPGITSIVPNAFNESSASSQTISAIKELLVNRELIHPAIVQLTSELSQYKIVGSIPRCIAMLEAFQIVIQDYETPEGTSLSRNLTNYLSHQIDILKKARPLSVTMGNAIRWLKQEISHIDPSASDKQSKQDLCEQIAQFAREKIELADQLIIENASQHIENGTKIVTYGASKVLTDLIVYNAVNLKKNVEVIVMDSRPLFEGRKMASILRNNNVNVTYALISSLDTVFNMDVDYVFLGAHSILSNGFLYSRVGTAMVAMSAKKRNIPVLVCCESLKFSQRVQLDSVTYNELADANDLVSINYAQPLECKGNKGYLLEQFIKEREQEKAKAEEEIKQKGKSTQQTNSKTATRNTTTETTDTANKDILDGWQNIPNLNIVNIMYDLTPPEYIKKIITEFGALPPSSVPVILREYKGSA